MTFTTFRLRVTDCEVEPLSPVTVMAYKPGGVAPVVVTVSEGLDGGVAGSGLTRHCGVPVVCTGVTVQGIVLKETGLLDPLGSTSRVGIEEPPGSTADGESCDETVSVNCP